MNKRVFLIVLDSFGVGEAPDAYKYHDEGSNTFRSCYRTGLLNIPNLKKLGLFNLDGIDFGEKEEKPIAKFARLQELSASKDTTAGHWEMSGLVTDIPFPTYKNGFPEEIIKQIEEVSGREVVCNKPYSGTEVIKDYYDDALKGKLIVYTSADSVLQIAVKTDVISVEELYDICKKVRKIMMGEHCVGRIIARPFIGTLPNLERTADRHDFSVDPVGETMLDRLYKNGKTVISIGKVSSIFNDRSISKQINTKSNLDGIHKIIEQIKDNDFNGICFANLVDFDSKYGHRNDAIGYAKALNEFDNYLKEMLENLKETDTLIITGDHGCDPATKSTDHSREYTPFLMYNKLYKNGENLGTIKGFNFIAKNVEEILKN